MGLFKKGDQKAKVVKLPKKRSKMAKEGLHDGWMSRKWWGLLISLGVIAYFALHTPIAVLGVVAPSTLGLYSIFCGINLGEKVLGTGGLLKGILGKKEKPADDSAGKEDEI